MHVAMIFIKPVFGAAALLKEEDQLEGTVRLIFQPAEEISEGASDVLATGLLEDVQGIIGFHNIPSAKSRATCFECWSYDGGVEKFKVTVTGVSSHAARPDLGVDTVTAVTNHGSECTITISRTVLPLKQLFCPLRTWMWAQLECAPKIRLF